jgi:hypothetical protein
VRDSHEGAKAQSIPYQVLAEQVASGRIKALSIKQPWPHRIFHEGKNIENRDWPTKGRGWFIIHAGKTSDGLPSAYGQIPMGGIVGMARIVDCVDKSDSEWFCGKYGFVLCDAFPVDLIPCKGQLGFFNPPVEALAHLAEILRAFVPSCEAK